MNENDRPSSRATFLEGAYWEKRSKDYVAWIYDLYGNFPLAQIMQRHFDSLSTAKRILEIGCGGLGIGLLWMFPNAYLRIGLDVLDISEIPSGDVPLFRELVICARKGVTYLKGSGESIPYAPGSFDLVICNNVLDHVCHPDRVLLEVAKSLKPGGTFCLGVDCSSLWGYSVRQNMRRISKNKTYILHPHDFTFQRLSRRLISHGFIPVDQSRVSWKNNLLGPRGRKCWVLTMSA